MKSEFAVIESLKKKIPRRMQGEIGIGDDAGVLSAGAQRALPLLLTTDTLVEGVDFIPGKVRPELIGRKALAINLSDIAAMGAEPLAFVVTLGLPRAWSEKWILRFYDGVLALARRYKISCAGGDITRARQFFASVALMGRARKNEIILRNGARPGDWMGVTGSLGGSILGRHLRFAPRIREARYLSRFIRPHAMIDISDGLLQDMGHILKASRVGAAVEAAAIPISRAAIRLAGGRRGRALIHALTDGEDFELLFTVSAAQKKKLEISWKRRFPKLRLSWIGRIRPGQRMEWRRNAKRMPAPRLSKTGFTHF